MNNRKLIIREVERLPKSGPEDILTFEPGVNLIVGKPNTGKTKWLSMIDFLMGDRGKPDEAFGDLAEKYDSVKALFEIDGEQFWVERQWKSQGNKTKIFIEDSGVTPEEFSQFMMERLKIPVVHFPKGNPFEERAWPELSWRTLLRHIYRQQRFWNDIADKQTEGEQHACMLQFLGIAEHLFSNKAGELVKKRKERWKLEGVKDKYIEILDDISREIAGEKEFQVALTTDSIDAATERIKTEVKTLESNKYTLLSQLRSSSVSDGDQSDSLEKLQNRWAQLNSIQNELVETLHKLNARLQELVGYKEVLQSEIGKIERAKSAGNLLSVIRVTNCPVCDQTINKTAKDEDSCYLCGQTWQNNPSAGSERVSAEIERLREEVSEVTNLIAKVSTERNQKNRLLRGVAEEILGIKDQLRPVQQAAASILPPDISLIDMEIGRLQERIRQLERIKGLLQEQKGISNQIDNLSQEIEDLQTAVNIENNKITYEYSSDLLADGMTNYLNVLNSKRNNLWSLGRIGLRLREKDFRFTIDGKPWSTALGGTLSLYFLLSYHYGLLSITNKESCHYPGFSMIDLPATLQDGSTIKDKENFIVEPFIDLMTKSEMSDTQVIFTGAAFEELSHVNRIELSKVWI